LWMAEGDLAMVCASASAEISFFSCRGKLAEALEKTMKAELIRIGWVLEKTHDLDRLLEELVSRNSDLINVVEPLCDALAEAYFTNRYPGFDLEDPNWPAFRKQLDDVANLILTVKQRVGSAPD
jgi:HEPN domain-containing protein